MSFSTAMSTSLNKSTKKIGPTLQPPPKLPEAFNRPLRVRKTQFTKRRFNRCPVHEDGECEEHHDEMTMEGEGTSYAATMPCGSSEPYLQETLPQSAEGVPLNGGCPAQRPPW